MGSKEKDAEKVSPPPTDSLNDISGDSNQEKITMKVLFMAVIMMPMELLMRVQRLEISHMVQMKHPNAKP